MQLRLPRKLMSEIPGQSCRALPACQSVEKGQIRTFRSRVNPVRTDIDFESGIANPFEPS